MSGSTEVDVEVVVVGAGFAGLYQLHRLRSLGVPVTLLEAGSGLGGIWWWNCYPGARVDSHVPVYEFSDEAIWRDWWWEERFPDWRAMRAYFEHVDRVWGLRPAIRFDTRLEGGRFDERRGRWELVAGGQPLTCRFLVLCPGFAARPYLPALPGLACFGGECHHTAWWPQEGVDLEGRRVGVIGTGASGVQVIQEAAALAERLVVFQRTPNLALPMRQRRLSREEQAAAKAHYPAIFERRTQTAAGFDFPHRGDSALAVPAAEREAVFEELWQQGGLAFWAGNYTDVLIDERANRLAYDFWRSKTLPRIPDPRLAEVLAPAEPPHPFGVKRASLEQRYYEAFAQENVDLVDLRTEPIEAFTPKGIRTRAREVELDLVVLATGFDAVTGGLTAIDLVGRDGRTLAEHWARGVRTHLGLACSGFPNLFFLYGPQSPSGFCNGPTCAEAQGDWVVELLAQLLERGVGRIEATEAAEEAWRAQVQAIAALTLFPRAASWYMGANVPGKPREMLNWPGGLPSYLAACRVEADAGYPGFRCS
jgi:cation diffusion facilitator CzcD-associated flavoprotein CzcO